VRRTYYAHYCDLAIILLSQTFYYHDIGRYGLLPKNKVYRTFGDAVGRAHLMIRASMLVRRKA